MVRIIADSSCDLDPAICQKHQIEIIPLTVTLEDGTTFLDGHWDMDEFYRHLSTCKKLPTTSQPSPALFEQAYTEAKEAGDEVICITITTGASGTYQSASIAAQVAEYEDHVHVIDSRNISLAMGGLVLYACKMRDKGMPVDEIVAELERIKTHIHLFAAVHNLENLHKGGRLSGTATFAGTLLGIKPYLTVADGVITLVGKARGLPGAYAAMFKHMDDWGGVSRQCPTFAAYSVSHQEMDPIEQYFDKVGYQPPLIGRIGTVVGTHVGAGAFGFAFFDGSADPIV